MISKIVKSDLEIAQGAVLRHINEIAQRLGVDPEVLEHYGKYKAKLPLDLIDAAKVDQAKLVLVTAITPTPPGEGKTTVSVGLTDGLNRIGKKSTVVLREPSLGPVFGIKGGATGGGHSQVVPMEDINLHFTGDFAAIEKANNLLAALIDNNVYYPKGNLGIDPRTVKWKRVLDMNDRSLRSIITGLGGRPGGTPREAGFNITAASEIMAILCLAESFADLKTKLGNIYVGDTYDNAPVYCRDLNAQGAMAALLKDAIKPNLVQTLEGNPAIIHGGPFANIAQGTNSVLATKLGLSLSDYVVTEAGFGADLGAEKFLNIKCGYSGLSPSAVVIVATVRALKYHGGQDPKALTTPNLDTLKAGFANLEKHLENIAHFGLPAVVAINRFASDSAEELAYLQEACIARGARVALSDGWAQGGAEVSLVNLRRLFHWEHHRMWPLFLEYACSTLWAFAYAITILLFILSRLMPLPDNLAVHSLFPPEFTGMLLGLMCLLQFVASLYIERRYEKKVAKSLFWVIWFPMVYWMIGLLTTLVAFPKVMVKRQRSRARWVSPDRGKGSL